MRLEGRGLVLMTRKGLFVVCYSRQGSLFVSVGVKKLVSGEEVTRLK